MLWEFEYIYEFLPIDYRRDVFHHLVCQYSYQIIAFSSDRRITLEMSTTCHLINYQSRHGGHVNVTSYENVS